jgi:hypothetical protein
VENFNILYLHLVYSVNIWFVLWSFWYVLWSFGTFYGYLVYFWRFGIFSPSLVCFIKKNLATLRKADFGGVRFKCRLPKCLIDIV